MPSIPVAVHAWSCTRKRAASCSGVDRLQPRFAVTDGLENHLAMPHAIEIAAAGPSGQDRARVVAVEDGWIVVVADGAGGTGNGALAADAVVSAASAATTITHDWCALLAALDGDPARLG